MKSDQWNIKETNCVRQTQNAGKAFNEFQYVADGTTSLIKMDLSILISNVTFVSVRMIVPKILCSRYSCGKLHQYCALMIKD